MLFLEPTHGSRLLGVTQPCHGSGGRGRKPRGVPGENGKVQPRRGTENIYLRRLKPPPGRSTYQCFSIPSTTGTQVAEWGGGDNKRVNLSSNTEINRNVQIIQFFRLCADREETSNCTFSFSLSHRRDYMFTFQVSESEREACLTHSNNKNIRIESTF